MNIRSPFEHLPVWILGALVFLVPLAHASTVSDPFALPKSILLQCGALALALIAVLERLAGRRERHARSLALYLLAGMMLSALASTLLSPNRSLSARDFADDAALVVIAWAAARSVRYPRHVASLLQSTLASASLLAAGCLIQTISPGFSLRVAGLSILPPAPGGATLGDAGLAAQFLLLALPIGIGAAALSQGVARLLSGLGLGLITATLIFAGRPEGWWAGGTIVALLCVTRAIRSSLRGRGLADLAPDPSGSSVRTAMVAAVVVLIALALSRLPGLAPGGPGSTFLSHVSLLAPTTGDPVLDRAAGTRGTVSLIALHPLGVGPGYWRHAFLEVAWSRVHSSPFSLGHQAIHVGNSLLELTAEIGIAGGLMFALLFVLLLTQAGLAASGDEGPWGVAGITLLDTLLAAAVTAFLGSPFQEIAPALLVFLTFGLVLAVAARADRPGGAHPTGPMAIASGSAGLGDRLLGIAGVAGWIVAAWIILPGIPSRIEAGQRVLVGQGLLSAGNVPAAVQVLNHASIHDSPEHLPHALLAGAWLRSGDPTRAVAEFDATLARSPWFLAAFLGRSTAWESLGRYDRAEEDLGAALQIWPGNPETLMARARLNVHRGRLDAALDDYRQVSQLNLTLADPLCGMGDVLLRLARYDAAIEAYRTCSQRNPRFPRVNINLGEAYERKGLEEMAVGFYGRAASIDERSTEPLLRLANALNALGRFCEAKQSLMSARDLETDPTRRAEIQALVDKVDAGCRAEQAARHK